MWCFELLPNNFLIACTDLDDDGIESCQKLCYLHVTNLAATRYIRIVKCTQ